MSPDTLRGRVVLLVLSAIVVLSAGLYALIGLLLWHARDVPDALWLAAGTQAGALVTWLVNSKSDRPDEVSIRQPDGEPVPVVEGDP